MEPIDAGAVDQGWELSAPDSQCAAHGRKAKDYFELSPNSVNEELPAVFTSILQSSAFHLVPHHSNDVVNL